jgi:hypothetical protein
MTIFQSYIHLTDHFINRTRTNIHSAWQKEKYHTLYIQHLYLKSNNSKDMDFMSRLNVDKSTHNQHS